MFVTLMSDVSEPCTLPCSDDGTEPAMMLCIAGPQIPPSEPKMMNAKIIQLLVDIA